MSLSLQEVEKIAHLARLELTDAQKKQYQQQLSAVLDYAERLNELQIEEVVPTSSAVAMQNVMRQDHIEPSLSIEDVLFNAPQQAQNQFLIHSVLDD